MREQSAEQSKRVASLETQLAVVQQEKGHRDTQLAALARRLAASPRIIDRTLDEARSARADRDSAQVQVLMMEAALDKAQWLVGIKSREAEENREAWNVAERRVANLRRKLSQTRATSDQRRRRVQVLGVQLAKAKQEAARQQSEHEHRVQEANDRLGQQEQSIQAVCDEARTQTEDLQTRLECLRLLALQIIGKNRWLEADLGAARASNQELTASVNECRDKAENVQREMDGYKAATEKELAELRAYRDRTKDPAEKLEAAQKRICELEGKVISAENKRDEAKRVLEIARMLAGDRERSLQNQVSQLQNEMRRLIK